MSHETPNHLSPTKIRTLLATANGIILTKTEYHGTFSSLMKLIIDNMGFPSAPKEKSVALLDDAAGRIGAIKSLEHLRSICGHVGALAMPRAISVVGVQAIFVENGNCLDGGVEKQVRGLARNLVSYIYISHCPEISFEKYRSNGRQGSSQAMCN